MMEIQSEGNRSLLNASAYAAPLIAPRISLKMFTLSIFKGTEVILEEY